jgi:FkbM family methyltransferase
MTTDTILTLYSTDTGDFWLPPDPGNDCVIQAIVNNQIWDNDVVSYIRDRITPNSMILDVGGNFGQMAVLFSKMLSLDGKVQTFEPDPFLYSVLCQNILQNNCTNVIFHNLAVWNESDKTLFYPKADFIKFESYGSYGIDPTATDGQLVNAITIDQLNLDPVRIIKLDIQGSELNALKGAVNTINKWKPLIIFEYEQMFDSQFNVTWQDYLDFIESIDYTIVTTINAVNIVIEPKINDLTNGNS